MKRNPKPFSVEIKKPRIQAERTQLPPKRLFEGLQAEISKIFEKDMSQAVAEPSAPPRRILPSIIEPFSSGSEPVEPVRQKRSVGAAPQRQIEFDWSAAVPKDGEDESTQVPVKVEAVSDVTIDEDVALVCDMQSAEPDSAPTNSLKARKRIYKPVEAIVFLGSPSQPERTPAAEIAQSASPKQPFTTSARRQIDRQAAAAQLPRHERWKRRLPSAAW
jgi:hypothetical protein